MKKYLLIILPLIALCYAGCKKDAPKGNGAPPAADSFLPVTAGSSWTYFIHTKYSSDTVTVKMSANNVTMNGKKYYTAIANSERFGSSGIYFYEANHVYAIYDFNNYANAILELQLYNDTATINHGWISSPTDNGKVGNTPIRTVSTIVDKNGTKVFSGKTYTNVIHTTVDVQYDLGAGYESTYVYEYYLVKGIGIIGYTATGLGESLENEGIISYDIK